jgi:hypothetical protein
MADEVYDSSEQDLLMEVFAQLLRSATKDGGAKRARGEKPPWWRDPSHEAAIFSHLNKWKHGEFADKDSGAHPFVHLAWRALAIAYQETYGKRDPKGFFLPEVKVNPILKDAPGLYAQPSGWRVGLEDHLDENFYFADDSVRWGMDAPLLSLEDAQKLLTLVRADDGWHVDGIFPVYLDA